MTVRALFAAVAAAVIFLGIHVVLLVATVAIAAVIILLLNRIASTVADCGARTVPRKRRPAW